ncbi:MAG: DNA repair protein RadA [Clostridiales Family XIII bacterium]|jgi:DNA repair protein RadA/Sms|nr:DNA repair protein RadA [Clostridiales Family XIII bacterium]
MAKKPESVYVCSECGYESPKWMGQCICGAWNSFFEQKITADSGRPQGKINSRSKAMAGVSAGKPSAELLNSVTSGQTDRIDTKIGELNRVLGGGVTKGSLTLIAGEPGIGKSTLILQAAINLARDGLDVLYVSGEESSEQIRMRADRITPDIPSGVLMLAETDMSTIMDVVAEVKPGLLIIDSIQTMYTDEITAAAGGVSQIRVSTDMLMHIGKKAGIPIFIVAHITKAGELAGPKAIEHLVDCVLSFSGERSRDFRLLTASKNRFGTTAEVGAFEMREEGLVEINDLSGSLLEGMETDTEGSIATAVYEGTRPLLMEIQALTAAAGTGFARRNALGISPARLSMIIAVLEKKAGLDLTTSDVYVNIVGGIRPEGTSFDLACALAIYSSQTGVIIDSKTLAVGEIGLAGEVRSIRNAERIATEASKLGFTKIILPEKNTDKAKALSIKNLKIIGVRTIADALSAI